MAPISLDKQIAGCNSPHDWLMSLAMDLAAFHSELHASICFLSRDTILQITKIDISK